MFATPSIDLGKVVQISYYYSGRNASLMHIIYMQLQAVTFEEASANHPVTVNDDLKVLMTASRWLSLWSRSRRIRAAVFSMSTRILGDPILSGFNCRCAVYRL